MDFDFQDTRCVFCDAGPLKLMKDMGDGEETVLKAIACPECGTTYDVAYGAPFLCLYEETDLLGLIEIAANADQLTVHDMKDLVRWNELVAANFEAENPDVFRAVEVDPIKEGPYLAYRFNDFVEYRILTKGLNLKGLKVLDVGAGWGFDCLRLVEAGAQVTALDYSPILIRQGRRNIPNARWVGGLSHALPFTNASFDLVFSNASLHHMRDIPQAIVEMLRVLRPGGWLITTCDSFRSDLVGEEVELQTFNRDPSVLLGINERVPRLTEYLKSLEENSSCLTPVVMTHNLNAVDFQGRTVFAEMNYPRLWDLVSAKKALGPSSGSVAMKVRIDQPIAASSAKQGDGKVRPGEFISHLGSQSEAMTFLSKMLPADMVDLPFPGEKGTKFELLNGWMMPESGVAWRRMYKRGRWYLRRTKDQDVLSFEVQAPDNGLAPPIVFIVAVSGDTVYEEPLKRGIWYRVNINIGDLPTDVPFTTELRCQLNELRFDDAVLFVRNRYFCPQEGAKPEGPMEPGQIGLPSLLEWSMKSATVISVIFYPGKVLPIWVMNVLRDRGVKVLAVVPEGQEAFFQLWEELDILSTYMDPNLSEDDPIGLVPDLIVAPTIVDARQLYKRIENVPSGKNIHAVLETGMVVDLSSLADGEEKVEPYSGGTPRIITPRLRSRLSKVKTYARRMLIGH